MEDPRKLKQTKGAMKSLFSSDAAASKHGSQSLRYDPNARPEGAPLPQPSASGQVIAVQGTVIAYRGEAHVGPCLAIVSVQASNTASIIIINREKKPLGKVPVDSALQLLPNSQDKTYATLYDSSFGGHWALMFKTEADCLNFVVRVNTVQHFINIDAGPIEPYQTMIKGEGAKQAGKHDYVGCAYQLWILTRVGQTKAYTAGKVVEEVTMDAPKMVSVGTNEVMVGIDEALIGMCQGDCRLTFLNPRKVRVSGIPNPEIGPGDSVVALITCMSVEKSSAASAMPGLDSDEEDIAPTRRPKRGKSTNEKPLMLTAHEERPKAPEPVASPTAAAPALDTNALLHTMLLNQLQQKSAPAEATGSRDVERSIDRLHYQIQSLYEKMDRMDVASHLVKNNATLVGTIEKIVKKAVGKMPINDADEEDVAKDRSALLAKIEQLKGRIEDLTDSYHKALENLGKHKDETGALKNDLTIEREAAAQRYNELKERRRLELVDAEVKHRQVIDKLREERFEEGKAKGYKEGYGAGKLDAMEMAGSSTSEEMKKMLHKKDADIVELESNLAQMEGRLHKERREHADQVDSLNRLIKRFEDKGISQNEDVFNDATTATKRIRRVMNGAYASIEAQFYATEAEKIAVEDALAMVLVSIKTETRSAVDEIKNEAALRETSDKKSKNEVNEAYAIQTLVPEPPKEPTEAEKEYARMREELLAYKNEQDGPISSPPAADSSAPPPPPNFADIDFGPPPHSMDNMDFDISALPTDGDERGYDDHDEPPMAFGAPEGDGDGDDFVPTLDFDGADFPEA